MLSRCLETLSILGPGMVVGTIVLLGGAGLGWVLGGYRDLPPVRIVACWITCVVRPLLKSPSWWRRTAIIFTNNTSVLAALLVLATWPIAARIGVVTLGLSMGIALRCLVGELSRPALPDTPRSVWARRRVRIGVALNLLEPPAIVVTLGLTLAPRSGPPTLGPAWETFVVGVVPALLLAAAGEALWMGAGHALGGVPDVARTQMLDTASRGGRPR